MNNQRGYGVLSLIISVVIVSIIVIVVMNFKSYLAIQESKMVKKETFYSHVDTELSELYSNEWTFNDKVIETKVGDLTVNLEDLGVNEYDTRVMKVNFEMKDMDKSFKMKDLKQSFELERSQYYDE